jgi:hypothetical protein
MGLAGEHHQMEDEPSREDDDADSAYDGNSLIGDDTRSLASYITDYRYENGRRYHAYRDGAYWVSCILTTLSSS